MLAVATSLADTVREALGDDTSDSAQRFAMETLSGDVARRRSRVRARHGSDVGSKFDDALQSFSKAVALDPKFGVAYGAMAATSRNLERQQDAEKYAKEAIRHLDSMTERERYRTRGFYYSITNDYQACVKEYGDLIARYSADAAARNNRALCLTQLRNMPQAVEEMRQVVKILPNRALYRENLALYADYSGDFADRRAGESRRCRSRDSSRRWRWRLRRLGRGRWLPHQRRTAGSRLSMMKATPTRRPASRDLAMYEGRFSDAERLLADGAAADVNAKVPDKAASKFAALAGVRLLRQKKAEAISATETGARQQSGRQDPVPGGAGARRGRLAGEGARVRRKGLPPSCRLSPRPMRRSSTGSMR